MCLYFKRKYTTKGRQGELGGLKLLTELDFGSVNRDTASWEKNPIIDEVKAWPPLSNASQESWHKAWVNFHASGTNKSLPPNTHLQQDLKQICYGRDQEIPQKNM